MSKNKYLIGAGAALLLLFGLAAGTQQRVVVTTSQFWRNMLTNESAQASLQALGTGSTTNVEAFTIGGIAYIDNQLYLTNPIVIGDDTTSLSNLVVQGWLEIDGKQTNYADLYLMTLGVNSALQTDGAHKIIALPGGGANTVYLGTTPPSFGSVPDAALSANVTLDNANNHFTGVNSYLSMQASTNAWPSATNNVDLNIEDQYFSSFTSCQILGVINKSTTSRQSVVLTIFNASATNETLTLPPTMLTREGLRSYTMTNGQDFIIWVRYEPGSGRTNSVACPNL